MDIKIDKDKKLIEKTVTGQLSPELCMMVIYEIATIVNMHKDYGILIDKHDFGLHVSLSVQLHALLNGYYSDATVD